MHYYPTILVEETKQGNKQNNLLTLTVSCEESCLIRRKAFFGLGLLRVRRIQTVHDKQFKTTARKKRKKNTMGYTTSVMGYYPRNG